MNRRRYQLAAGASLGVALLLAGCGAPELEPETAAVLQASVRDIATAAAAGDQAGATQLALDLSQAVAVAQGQGTVTSDRAAHISETIDELLIAIAAEVGQTDPAAPTAPAVPVPEPTTNTPVPLPETPAETPAPPVSPPSGDDEEGGGDNAENEDDKAQRDAEKELEKQQREQEKLEEEAEREQEQREDAEGDA
ncbi:hypothetical protein [Arthrobacter flavus]|uniref:Mucin-associated surface protein (MASP) n=1 Tax=Arthrobacter flavus TaxID=95172 RepID=A0ABW4Q8P7_9MICC